MIRTDFVPLVLVFSSAVSSVHASWSTPFISELHYDNAGGDVGEFVAVTGPSGLDLAGWQLAFYNGGDGRVYRTAELTGTLGGGGGLAELAWPFSGIQNGPDAVALLSPLDAVIDFIAYEAAVVAADGAARGLDAQLLPAAEDGLTPAGLSLQRVGTAGDVDWVVAAATPGLVNPGLSLPGHAAPGRPGSDRPDAAVHALPSVGIPGLWLAGMVSWLLISTGRRRRSA